MSGGGCGPGFNFHAGLVRSQWPVDLALAAALPLAPLARHLAVERRFNNAIELIDVHGTDAVIEALIRRWKALDRLLVLAPLVGVAGVQPNLMSASTAARLTSLSARTSRPTLRPAAPLAPSFAPSFALSFALSYIADQAAVI